MREQKYVTPKKNVPEDFKSVEQVIVSPNVSSRKKPSKMSQNMEALASPKKKTGAPTDDSHWAIKNATLKYKASKRIKELATPKSYRPKYKNKSITPQLSQVKSGALKYVPSPRILDLAKPK